MDGKELLDQHSGTNDGYETFWFENVLRPFKIERQRGVLGYRYAFGACRVDWGQWAWRLVLI